MNITPKWLGEQLDKGEEPNEYTPPQFLRFMAVHPDVSSEKFKAVNALQEGHFELTSGLHSEKYFQCTRVTEYPLFSAEIAANCANVASSILGNYKQPTVIIAPAIGAIAFGHEVAEHFAMNHNYRGRDPKTQIKSMFAEKISGTKQFELRRGFELTPEDRVIIVENVITTGGSAQEVAKLVEEAGAEVIAYIVIVDRSGGAFAPGKPVIAYATQDIVTYDPKDCPLCQQGISLHRPGSKL